MHHIQWIYALVKIFLKPRPVISVQSFYFLHPQKARCVAPVPSERIQKNRREEETDVSKLEIHNIKIYETCMVRSSQLHSRLPCQTKKKTPLPYFFLVVISTPGPIQSAIRQKNQARAPQIPTNAAAGTDPRDENHISNASQVKISTDRTT